MAELNVETMSTQSKTNESFTNYTHEFIHDKASTMLTSQNNNSGGQQPTRSYATHLDILCNEMDHSSDLYWPKTIINTINEATTRGGCFFEKVIARVLKTCLCKLQSGTYDKTKLMNLIESALFLKFNRYQMTECLKRPELRLTSEQIIKLLCGFKEMLERTNNLVETSVAINWLNVLYDSNFVDIATDPEAQLISSKIQMNITALSKYAREIEQTTRIVSAILQQTANKSDKSMLNNDRLYFIEVINL